MNTNSNMMWMLAIAVFVLMWFQKQQDEEEARIEAEMEAEAAAAAAAAAEMARIRSLPPYKLPKCPQYCKYDYHNYYEPKPAYKTNWPYKGYHKWGIPFRNKAWNCGEF